MRLPSARPQSGIVAVALLVGGCASSPPRPAVPSTVGEPVVIDAPRSQRGNPNFYEVLGRRYHVMASADGYRADGVASWYGRDFHGRSTSSGERYDMFAMTAAHRTLPLPTWVEVTNRRNGKRIIVKVNDRGPFVDDRLIDLSYAAALALDMVGAGTAPVFVRALGAPAIAALSAAATGGGPTAPVPGGPPSLNGAGAAAATPASEMTFVQVGAFAEHANASRVLARIKSSGVEDAHVHLPDGSGAGVHRVHVGPFASDNEFEIARSKLRALGFADGHLIIEHFYE